MRQTEIYDIRSALDIKEEENCILKLRVNNHPGVMSHICGLFARRAFNVEKIICLPLENGKESRIFLMVGVGKSLNQIVNQLLKLEDVHQVDLNQSDRNIFAGLEELINQETLV